LLIISSLIFISSTLWIFNEFNFSKAQNVEEIVESINSSEEKFSQKKNFSPDTFLTFYIYEGRIYSRDATINWRFDIWQDNFEDQFNKNKIIQGYGYSSRLPVMNDPEEPGRYGEDGLNEHVHNYFVTVFARGGIILFIVTISYWFYLINEYRRVHKNNYILVLIIPALLNASFDVAMESVQFPYLLLLSIGYLFNAKQEFQNI
jgi:O-antigen ligase